MWNGILLTTFEGDHPRIIHWKLSKNPVSGFRGDVDYIKVWSMYAQQTNCDQKSSGEQKIKESNCDS